MELPVTVGGPLELRVLDRDRIGHDEVCGQVHSPWLGPCAAGDLKDERLTHTRVWGGWQAVYYVGQLMYDDRVPDWLQATLYLSPAGSVRCDLLFTPTSWNSTRITGMPLAHAVRDAPSAVPAIVAMLVRAIESRRTQTRTGGRLVSQPGGTLTGTARCCSECDADRGTVPPVWQQGRHRRHQAHL
jgi:hypothetical protein